MAPLGMNGRSMSVDALQSGQLHSQRAGAHHRYRVIVKETVTKMVFVEAPTEPEAGLRVLKG